MTETPFKDLQSLMQRIEQSTGLEALAVVTREGIRLACAVSGDVDSDIFSAATATLVNVGEETLRQLSQGTLTEVIIRGNKGFTIIMRGSPETLLVGASRDQIRLGYYIGLMKIYANKVTKIMEIHPLHPEELLGFRKTPAAVSESATEPTPTISPETVEPTPAESSSPATKPEVEVTPKPSPSIEAVEAPGLETVSVESVSTEVDDVSVDDKEAILAALKALGFDEPE
jgi:predicted regulator of Ras-like GTPase activity (Roadblock/LC7/MglB family)